MHSGLSSWKTWSFQNNLLTLYFLFKGGVVYVVVVQSLSYVRLFATSRTAAQQASLSLTISQGLLRFMSVESMMLSNLSTSADPFSSCLQSFPHQGLFLA